MSDSSDFPLMSSSSSSPSVSSESRQIVESTISQLQHERLAVEIGGCSIVTIDYMLHKDARICNAIETSLQLCSYKGRFQHLYCFVCNVSVPNGFPNYYKHICTEQHLNMLYLILNRGKKRVLEFLRNGVKIYKNSKNASCFFCGAEMSDHSYIIQNHISLLSHRSKSILWLKDLLDKPAHKSENFRSIEYSNICEYICQICYCSMATEIQFIKHLQADTHKQKLRKYLRIFNFYYCTTCATFWFGLVEHHQNSDDVNKMLCNFVSNLNEKVAKYMINMQKTLNIEITVCNDLIAHYERNLHTMLRDLYNDVTLKHAHCAGIYILGGMCTMLPMDNKIQFYVDFKHEGSSAYSRYKQLNGIESCLRSQNWLYPYLDRHTSSILVWHMYTNILCEITVVDIDNGADMERDQLIRYFNEAYPLCRHMMLFIINWTRHFQLAETFTINAIVWLVIFYFQHTSVFPSIMRAREKLISGSGITRCFNITIKDPKKSIKRQLYEFFRFYANIDYSRYLICPLLGQLKRKYTFTTEMRFLSNKKMYRHSTTTVNYENFIESEMCLQNPYNLTNIITSNITKSTVEDFRTICDLSAQLILFQ